MPETPGRVDASLSLGLASLGLASLGLASLGQSLQLRLKRRDVSMPRCRSGSLRSVNRYSYA
jgi:hypothetical protein